MGRVLPEFVVEFDHRIDAADDRLDAAAYHRNFAPMLAVLRRVLGDRSGHVLEIGSGTGQHVVGFAEALSAFTWWPTDPNPNHLKSIKAWRRHGTRGGRNAEIAARHGATPKQIALAWLLKRSPAMLPIPGTLSHEHAKEDMPR